MSREGVEDVRAAITAAQAERIEFLRELGVIPYARNTFVKTAVERYLQEMTQYALDLERLEARAGDERAGTALQGRWEPDG